MYVRPHQLLRSFGSALQPATLFGWRHTLSEVPVWTQDRRVLLDALENHPRSCSCSLSILRAVLPCSKQTLTWTLHLTSPHDCEAGIAGSSSLSRMVILISAWVSLFPQWLVR